MSENRISKEVIDRIKIGNTNIAIDDSCAIKDPIN